MLILTIFSDVSKIGKIVLINESPSLTKVDNFNDRYTTVATIVLRNAMKDLYSSTLLGVLYILAVNGTF